MLDDRELTQEEVEARMAEIMAGGSVEPTPDELAAIAEYEADDHSEDISLEEFKAQRQYSGRLLLRIPRELHRELAMKAKANGVSLNQYAMYKLAR